VYLEIFSLPSISPSPLILVFPSLESSINYQNTNL